MKNATNRKTAVLIGLAIIAVAFLAVNYAGTFLGKLGKNDASIKVTVPEPQTVIYIDGKSVQTTDSKNQAVTVMELSEGNHTVILSKEGYWPWTKDVTTESGKTEELTAFMLPELTKYSLLASTRADFARAAALIAAAKLPTETRKLLSESGNMALWVTPDNVLKAEWLGGNTPPAYFCGDSVECPSVIEVVKPATRIQSVSFYKNRDDVAVFGAGESIFAIELDRRAPQNFQPVYVGTAPVFVQSETDPGSLYMKDDGKVYQVTL